MKTLQNVIFITIGLSVSNNAFALKDTANMSHRVTYESKEYHYSYDSDFSHYTADLSKPLEDPIDSNTRPESKIAYLMRSQNIVSVAMLNAKAKTTEDRVMAALQLYLQKKGLKGISKIQLLNTIYQESVKSNLKFASAYFASALTLSENPPPSMNANVSEQSKKQIENFDHDLIKSKPIGFYSEAKDLSALFRQDRFLQSEFSTNANKVFTLEEGHEVLSVIKNINKDDRDFYQNYLKFVSHLTNAPRSDTSFVSAASTGNQNQYHFFPPLRSFETDLVNQLNQENPSWAEKSDLMPILISRVKSGKFKLQPSDRSGWYDYQAHAFEAFLNISSQPESQNIEYSKEYLRLLEEYFKQALSLARETQIKDVEIALMASTAKPPMPETKIKVWVSPVFTVEPLPTYYTRRAASYDFLLKGLLEFLTERELNAITAGPKPKGFFARPKNVRDEILQIRDLFMGAAELSTIELGMPSKSESELSKKFKLWVSQVDVDEDVERDQRMMVPVGYDPRTKITRSWAFLGYDTSVTTRINFQKNPPVEITDANGVKLSSDRIELHYVPLKFYTPRPIVLEIQHKGLLTRDEFRKICDEERTIKGIRKRLEGK